MARSKKMNDGQISKQNISYYDEIAANYDAIMNKDAANKIVRDKVAAKFTSLVNGGTIIDFGGGTGQDFGWLLQRDYHITFCEPSAAMRQIAIKRSKTEFSGTGISFLDDDESDFRNWNEIFPFEQKVRAVLANFAVINCIPDIELLFEKLALAIEPGGTVIALMLDNSFMRRMKSGPKNAIKSFFSGNPVSILIGYNDERQLVYIHSTKAIRKAVENSFEFMRLERLHGFGFCLIHLVRK
jgi:SAM-dependent methyltransferase